MDSQKKYDVFISYARKDFQEVNRLVLHLKERIPEISIWFDITGIESGDEFEEKIVAAINNSSYVLFALSKNSISSKWTKDEVVYANNMGKKVIPVLLEGAHLQDWFLFKFGRVDCIDSVDVIQLQKLITNLSNWTGKSLQKEIVSREKPEKRILEEDIKVTNQYISLVANMTINEDLLKTRQPKKDSKNSRRKNDSHQVVPRKKEAYLYIPISIAMMIVIVLGWAIALSHSSRESSRVHNGHAWVDLGLSVKWATFNVGATSIKDRGHYFAWGETCEKSVFITKINYEGIPYSEVNPVVNYDWHTYKYTDAKHNITKYNAKDSLMTLELKDDAAHENWGGSWRMQTKAEQDELINNCKWKKKKYHGVYGYKLISKINGNSIFLPTTGYINGERGLIRDSERCYYWTSSLCDEYKAYIYGDASDIGHRYLGCSIRAVCP